MDLEAQLLNDILTRPLQVYLDQMQPQLTELARIWEPFRQKEAGAREELPKIFRRQLQERFVEEILEGNAKADRPRGETVSFSSDHPVGLKPG